MDTVQVPTTLKSVSLPPYVENTVSNAEHGSREATGSINNESNGQNCPYTQLSPTIKQEATDGEGIAEFSCKRKRDSEDDKEQDNTDKMLKTDSSEMENSYSILITGFPTNWTSQEIHKFVSRILEDFSVKMAPEISNKQYRLKLTFNSVDQWLTAKDKLENVKVDGKELQLSMEGPSYGVRNGDESDSESGSTVVIPPTNQDVWETDPKGLYGLKPDFLAKLNITPPIGKWLHITNFRCDKSELRDVLEFAGNVVVCSVINNPQKYAKVMYSHPLEAVQAISMLNDQLFYGQKLQIKMEQITNINILLPKGLTSHGPGLGEDGIPVRDVVREYERFLNGKSTQIDQSIFEGGNVGRKSVDIPTKDNSNSLDSNKALAPPNTSPGVQTSASPNVQPPRPQQVRPPMNQRPQFRPNIRPEPQNLYLHANCNPVPMYRAPMSGGPILLPGVEMRPQNQYPPGFLPVPGGRMPMQFVQSVPGPIPAAISMNAPVPGVSPNWLNPQNTGLAPQMFKGPDATTLRITNLPPSTSFPGLCGKLSTLAQVTSLEFTTPGCAVVRFASPGEAEKCFQNYRNIMLS